MRLFSSFVLLGTLLACHPRVGELGDGGLDAGQVDAGQPGDAGYVVHVTGQAHPVGPDFFGANGVTQYGPAHSFDNASFDAALAPLQLSTLRYPGGTISGYWDWHTGWFTEQAICCDGENYDPNPITLDVLKTGLIANGAHGLFVLNMITPTQEGLNAGLSPLEDQLAMLHAAADTGMEVRYVELGNELYFVGPGDDPPGAENQYLDLFPTAADYAGVADVWARRIHEEFPQAQVAVVGGLPGDDSHNAPRRATWNQVMGPALDAGVDALTLHPYAGLAAHSNLTYMLATPFVFWRMQHQLNSLADADALGKDFWFTEFNAGFNIDDVAMQWTHGLANATLALVLLEDVHTRRILIHNVTGGDYALVFKNAAPVGSSGQMSVPFALTSSGEAMVHVGAGSRGAEHAQQLAFEQAPMVPCTAPDGGVDSYPALYGWEFTGATGTQVVVVNNSAAALDADFAAVFPAGFTLHQTSGPPSTFVTGAQGTLLHVTGSFARTAHLPAYSVSRLSP